MLKVTVEENEGLNKKMMTDESFEEKKKYTYWHTGDYFF
jgi:hypothetical protein